MSLAHRLQRIRLHRVNVSHRTTWMITEIATTEGIVGLGECSDLRKPEWAAGLVDAVTPVLSVYRVGDDLEDLDQRMTALIGDPADGFEAFDRRMVIGSIVAALCDIQARINGVSLAGWLGGTVRPSVPLYANINRAPLDRTPAAFARVAAAAVDAGFDRIKLAPFDGPALDGTSLLETGSAHLDAVRAAVGRDPTIYVDIHHRLSRADLIPAIEAMESHGIGWIEDAVDVRSPADLEWLRGSTTIPMAGGEQLTDPAEVASVVDRGHLDFLLLDPKYIGGPLRFRSMLGVVHDVALTLHDPTSPVSTAVSAQLGMLSDELAHIEFAFGEKIDRATFVQPAERIRDGELMTATGNGSGIRLLDADHGGRRTTSAWTLDGQTGDSR